LGLTVLGNFSGRAALSLEKIGSITLEVGDLLVVQGEKESFTALQQQRQLAVLSELPIAAPRRHRGALAVLLFGGVAGSEHMAIVPLAPAFAERCCADP
jgi:hypothetical protein